MELPERAGRFMPVEVHHNPARRAVQRGDRQSPWPYWFRAHITGSRRKSTRQFTGDVREGMAGEKSRVDECRRNGRQESASARVPINSDTSTLRKVTARLRFATVRISSTR